MEGSPQTAAAPRPAALVETPCHTDARTKRSKAVVLVPAVRFLKADKAGLSYNRSVRDIYAAACFRWSGVDLPAHAVGHCQIVPDLPFVLDEQVVLLQAMSFVPQCHFVVHKKWEKRVVVDVAEEVLGQ